MTVTEKEQLSKLSLGSVAVYTMLVYSTAKKDPELCGAATLATPMGSVQLTVVGLLPKGTVPSMLLGQLRKDGRVPSVPG